MHVVRPTPFWFYCVCDITNLLCFPVLRVLCLWSGHSLCTGFPSVLCLGAVITNVSSCPSLFCLEHHMWPILFWCHSVYPRDPRHMSQCPCVALPMKSMVSCATQRVRTCTILVTALDDPRPRGV